MKGMDQFNGEEECRPKNSAEIVDSNAPEERRGNGARFRPSRRAWLWLDPS